ncbi:prepilin peptidase, partial [archaeon]|nr:prepilin peptidase [archaeon]
MIVGFALALAGVAYSAFTDLKTGYVEDWLSHAMIVSGIVLALFTLPAGDMLWTLALSAVVFVAGLAAYSFGQMGGGDVKLFTAIALLIPAQPRFLSAFLGIQPAPAVYPFIVSVFVLSGILYMYVIPVIFLRKLLAN